MYRVARNAIYLYARMIVNMLVGIFSVRIMLDALGVDDYGLQAVAGGVLGMFTLIVEGLGTSTSRYITYELGRGDPRRLNDTFCTAMLVFIAMAAVIVVLGETVGLWFLTHKLNIPAGREHAAMVVFQLSVTGAAVNIPQAPYSAVMLAHEKFNISAYLSLFSSFARLGLLYYVARSSLDHLILYQWGMFAISMSTLLFSRIYCTRHFPESRFRLRFDSSIFRPMLTFSIWETFGAINRTLKGTGYQMVLNMFHGVALNAAIGIGTTVSGAVTGLSYTVSAAFKPTIVKLFAGNDINGMKASIHNATLISMVLYGIFAIPLLVELDFVMNLWLNDIPPLSRELCAIQLILNTILMAYLVCAESLKSMGHNRGVNILQLVDALVAMSAVFVLLYLRRPPLWACTAYNMGLIVNLVLTLWLLMRRTGLKFVTGIIDRALIRVLLTEILVYLILQWLHDLMGPSLITLATVSLMSILLFSTAALLWILPPAVSRELLNQLLAKTVKINGWLKTGN